MTVLPYIVIVILVLFSAFFSGSEIAFNSSNRMRLKKAAEGGSKSAALAYRITENFTPHLSAILVGNNVVNIAASTCSTMIVMDIFAACGSENDALASVVSTVIMTLIILTFGEIIPKIFSKEHADDVAGIVAYPIAVLTVIFYPIYLIVSLLLFVLRKMWGKDEADDAPTVTEEELPTIIDTAEEEGVIDEEQSELLQSTLEFPDTTVYEIIKPRIDVTAIDIEDDWETVRNTVLESPYSRIPVYEDSIDNIIGILNVNRFYKALLDKDEIDIRSILLEPLFLHRAVKLPVALDEMRTKKMHLAVVVDEFGGTDGIVTMEDILEELVGDIWDESDDIVTEIQKTGENEYEVIGDMNIDDFFDEIDFPAKDFESEYTTVGGWAVEMLDANPHVGDSFSYENLYVIVTEMDDMRVTKLSVVVNEAETDEED